VVRTAVLAVLAVLLLPAAAKAHGSGGAPAGPATSGFTATPGTVAPGARVTFAFKATPGARVRVDLLAPGRAVARVRLGRVGGSGRVRVAWKANVPGGTYTARLVVSGAGVTRYLRVPLIVSAPAKLATAGVFPVQGPYTFGDGFGAARDGHVHQGQDIAAAEGTPVVSPVAGTVFWIAYQAKGAGHYVVIAGADGRHYVFMHLQADSVAVAKNAAVTPGQRLASVGSTGDSTGPHLHFEIWVDGWWATKASTPIDPLADLQAWAAQ